jgi:hypothetical protein
MHQYIGYGAEITRLEFEASVRALTLGLDQAGRVVLHDRNAGEILAGGAGCLLGTSLGDLVMGSTVDGSPLHRFLESIRCGQEATAVLTLRPESASRSVTRPGKCR